MAIVLHTDNGPFTLYRDASDYESILAQVSEALSRDGVDWVEFTLPVGRLSIRASAVQAVEVIDGAPEAEALLEIAKVLPTGKEWDGGPGRLEDIADILDRYGIERPSSSDYLPH